MLTRAEFSEDDKLCVDVRGVGGRGAGRIRQLDDVRVTPQLTLRHTEREEVST